MKSNPESRSNRKYNSLSHPASNCCRVKPRCMGICFNPMNIDCQTTAPVTPRRAIKFAAPPSVPAASAAKATQRAQPARSPPNIRTPIPTTTIIRETASATGPVKEYAIPARALSHGNAPMLVPEPVATAIVGNKYTAKIVNRKIFKILSVSCNLCVS